MEKCIAQMLLNFSDLWYAIVSKPTDELIESFYEFIRSIKQLYVLYEGTDPVLWEMYNILQNVSNIDKVTFVKYMNVYLTRSHLSILPQFKVCAFRTHMIDFIEKREEIITEIDKENGVFYRGEPLNYGWKYGRDGYTL